MNPPIKIWPFHLAYKELQDLSTNGGDEDWVAVIPDYLEDLQLPWMAEGSAFGCCCVNEYDHPTIKGYKVRIGCHS